MNTLYIFFPLFLISLFFKNLFIAPIYVLPFDSICFHWQIPSFPFFQLLPLVTIGLFPLGTLDSACFSSLHHPLVPPCLFFGSTCFHLLSVASHWFLFVSKTFISNHLITINTCVQFFPLIVSPITSTPAPVFSWSQFVVLLKTLIIEHFWSVSRQQILTQFQSLFWNLVWEEILWTLQVPGPEIKSGFPSVTWVWRTGGTRVIEWCVHWVEKNQIAAILCIKPNKCNMYFWLIQVLLATTFFSAKYRNILRIREPHVH